MSSHTVEGFPDASAAARRGAEYLAKAGRAALAARGEYTLALSRTTPAFLQALAREDLPWERTTIFQVDERIAPGGHPDRNLTHLLASLPGGVLVRAMPVESEDLESAASTYADLLPAQLDLIHLGLGADGHTASLVPGDPVLEVTDRSVAVTGRYGGYRRMTLTYPGLERARELLWLVTGASKADALARLLARDTTIPAGRVAVRESLVLADRAASSAGP